MNIDPSPTRLCTAMLPSWRSTIHFTRLRPTPAAYYLTTVVIGAGMMASLLKSVDYEEAIVLGVLLLALRRARPAFDRKAALFTTRFSPAWVAAVVAALAASVWLGFFAFKHIEYSNDLWWRFALGGEASRFLRGSVAAATVVLLVAVARLIGHAPTKWSRRRMPTSTPHVERSPDRRPRIRI